MTATGDERVDTARRAGAQFVATQQDLQAILNAVPAMIGYWDADARNKLANEAYVDYFGKTPEEIRGRHISEVLGPEIYERNLPFIEAVLRGEPQLFDRTIPTPSGQQREVQASYVPDFDEEDGSVRGFFVLVTDITPRREAERALAAAEARFRKLFESAPIGTFFVDCRKEVIDVNVAGTQLLGRPREEIIGRSLLEFTHPEDREEAAARFAGLWTGEVDSYRYEKRCVHALGHTIWTQLDMTLLHETDAEEAYAVGQMQDVSARHRHQRELEHLADHDALTGLLNRRGMARELERHVAYTLRYGHAGCLLVLDLDNFKHVNDTLGHKAGDDLIIEVAEVMARRLRATDVLARLGGDEFAIILPHASVQDGMAVARSIADSLRARPALEGTVGTRLTVSAGVAGFDSRSSAEEMLVRADLAMYDAKEGGKDTVAAYASEGFARPKIEARIDWLRRIRTALDEDGLQLLAQPIVDAVTGRPVCHELLVRMVGDGGELVSPTTFLYIAERFDLIQEIDRWVAACACRWLGEARSAGEHLALAVNVSGKSLVGDSYCDHLSRKLVEHGADPAGLMLEITETSAAANVREAGAFGQRVKELGCDLAIDDFGAGFGSFYYLKHVPFDVLKIDGEFVTSAPTSATDALIVAAVRDLAHGMGRRVVAEWCADEPLRRWLSAFGVDMLQGYATGKPVPVGQVSAIRAA